MQFRMDRRKKVKHEWKEGDFKKGTLLLAGDSLIVLGENGELALVQPTPTKFVEKARISVAKDGRFWTMPVVAHKRLYVRDEEMIYCYDLVAR
jgi:outer membrane protein assembly factor BamB